MDIAIKGCGNRFWLGIRLAGMLIVTSASGASNRELTNVAAVRSLSRSEAEKKLAVHLQGVVTSPSGWKNSFFLQDATAGISVDLIDARSIYQSGDRLELQGVTQPGSFAPSVLASRVKIVGHGALPEAALYSMPQLAGGSQDSQWITVSGLVHAVEDETIWGHRVLVLTLDTGVGLYNVRILNVSGDQTSLVDAMVQIRGVCGTVYNGRRQFIGIRLFVPSLHEVTIIKPGYQNPYDAPQRELNELLQFGQGAAPYHRIRVRGTLTYQRLGKNLYIQDRDSGLLVHSKTREAFALGTEIEAAGFASQGTYSPELQDAVVRVIGKRTPVNGRVIAARDIEERKDSSVSIPYDGQLIQIDGQVVERTETATQQNILLRQGGILFPLKLDRASLKNESTVLPGAVIRVTGICVAIQDRNGNAESFEVLARSASDVLTIQNAPWWNPQHVVTVFCLSGFAILGTLGLVYVQRRRIQRQQQALVSSAQGFQDALDNVPLLAVSLDSEGRVTACNHLLLKLLGRQIDEVIGLEWQSHFVTGGQCVLETHASDEADNQPLRMKHQDYVRAGDGSERLASWFNALLHDSNGHVIGSISLGEDVSEGQRKEAALVDAVAMATAANRAKSEFLAHMSHEIRTPMNGIIGLTELVLDSDLTLDQRENLEMVQRSAEALLVIINEVLDYSKIESGNLTLEPIDFVLEDALFEVLGPLALQASRKNLELSWSIDPQIPRRVVGDPGRLRQVVMNLLGNAIKFTRKGGVGVRVDLAASGNEQCPEDEIELHFRISDTGIGIPVEKQNLIFEAFAQADETVTREFGGTGLGLSISSRLVRLFGGQIWVESTQGTGSTFHFTAKVGVEARETEDLHPVALAGLRVLVADDNAINRRLLQQTLQAWQMEVTLAQDGAGAAAEFARAEDQGQAYHLVILDAIMPELSGFEAANQIRSRSGADETKLILLTSDGKRGDAALCHATGIDGYLHKPIKGSDLRRGLLETLGSPVQPRGQRRLVTRHTVKEARRRILLAEDNVVNQRLAIKILERLGHSVSLATNGREALEMIERSTFDLVLMDLQMPVLGGFEATTLIRERETLSGEHIRIIALTANAMAGDREKCFAAGMDGYLSKPIRVDELIAII